MGSRGKASCERLLIIAKFVPVEVGAKHPENDC